RIALSTARRHAVVPHFPDADQAGEHADVHDAAQDAFVAADGPERRQRRHGEAIAHLGQDEHHLAGKGHASLPQADEPAMSLADAITPPQERAEGRPRGRHHFLRPGIGRIDDPAAGTIDLVEEGRTLASRLAAVEAEAAAPHGFRIHADKDVAGVAGAYLAAYPDREGGVKIAAPHPARSLRAIAGPDRPEDRIGTARFSRLHQADEPILQRRLVVVDEGHETRTAGVKTGIAGDGDVAR